MSWEGLLTPGEWTALGGGLLMGWLVTETVKRVWRKLRPCPLLETGWMLPLMGFTITAVSTWTLWPVTGLFPHPVFAALVSGFSVPIVYKVVVALLRKTGQDWLADILSGKKSSKEKPS